MQVCCTLIHGLLLCINSVDIKEMAVLERECILSETEDLEKQYGLVSMSHIGINSMKSLSVMFTFFSTTNIFYQNCNNNL